MPLWVMLSWSVFIGLFSFTVAFVMASGEWPWRRWRRRG